MPHIITCTNNHLFRKEESLVLLFIQGFLVDPSLLAAANSLRRFVCARSREIFQFSPFRRLRPRMRRRLRLPSLPAPVKYHPPGSCEALTKSRPVAVKHSEKKHLQPAFRLAALWRSRPSSLQIGSASIQQRHCQQPSLAHGVSGLPVWPLGAVVVTSWLCY